MKDRPPPRNQSKTISAEQWVLLIGLTCFLVFVWIVAFLFVPLLANRQPKPAAVPATPAPSIAGAVTTQEFILPPTWTPGPTQAFAPTPPATPVSDGLVPTRIYTPRPTSLPGLVLPFFPRPQPADVIDLARIMQGESPGDKEAAYYVGWVAKNRLLHPGYGNTYLLVSSGFFGYRPNLQPSDDFMKLAAKVIRAKEDPTQGCLYALSRTDITKLRVPAAWADVTKGEWFFFRVWPLSRRT